jgi:hypothetical protein
MAQRVHYWSCSKFANWLRGTPKPGAHTGDGWRRWHKDAKTTHPLRYWLAEEGLDAIQGAIWWPVDKLYDFKYYINNRYVTRTHSLTAHPKDIKPGTWRDVGNRFLPCLFNELVDFVEVEKAWSNIAWSKEAREKYNPPFWGWGWFRWRSWRCPEAGIEHLNWEITLTNEEWLDEDKKNEAEPTGQAVAAKEILELYTWWKEVYPNRKDPHDLSGWSDWCDRRREKLADDDEDGKWLGLLGSGDDQSEEERAETRRILDLSNEIEKQQDEEDTEMMVRLIKLRGHLWT